MKLMYTNNQRFKNESGKHALPFYVNFHQKRRGVNNQFHFYLRQLFHSYNMLKIQWNKIGDKKQKSIIDIPLEQLNMTTTTINVASRKNLKRNQLKIAQTSLKAHAFSHITLWQSPHATIFNKSQMHDPDKMNILKKRYNTHIAVTIAVFAMQTLHILFDEAFLWLLYNTYNTIKLELNHDSRRTHEKFRSFLYPPTIGEILIYHRKVFVFTVLAFYCFFRPLGEVVFIVKFKYNSPLQRNFFVDKLMIDQNS